jgi:hypothetical protein
MTKTRFRLLQTIVITGVLTCGFIAGYTWPRDDYQAGYERALDDVASGEITVSSQATRLRDAQQALFIREAEYERVVSAIAEAYHKDPSEVEVDAGLVNERGELKR